MHIYSRFSDNAENFLFIFLISITYILTWITCISNLDNSPIPFTIENKYDCIVLKSAVDCDIIIVI